MKPGRIVSGLVDRVRHAPGIFRRFKFWIVAFLFILLLGVLGPWVGLLTKILSGLGRVLEPLLTSPVGRFLTVNVLVILLLWYLYRKFRARGRRLLGAWALDRFLAGLMGLASGRFRQGVRSFSAVIRMGRWVDLREAVPEHPEILADARIKLALCHRELGEVARAMKHLELLKSRDLSPRMRRDLAEAKAFVYALSDQLMEETVDREIANALEQDPQNRRLLRLRRDRAEAVGDLPTAIAAQRKLLKTTPPPERPEARTHLAALHARNALRLYQAGREEEARAEIARSRSSDPALVLPNLLAGDLAVEAGEPRAAVREWARTPSLPSLERIRRLLREGVLRDEGDAAFVAREFPRSGILLVLGAYYLEQGKLRKARNCVRKFEELGLANRYSAHLMAEILRAEGHAAAAEREDWRALKGLLGADAGRALAGSPGRPKTV